MEKPVSLILDDVDMSSERPHSSSTGTSSMSIDNWNPDDAQGKAVSSNLYEARQTPHAGIGLFATTNIPAGTRIFCEEALVALPDEKDITDLYRALEALPADKQAAFDSLVGHKHKHDTDFIATVRNGYKGPSDSFEDVVDKHESAWEKYEANRFTVRSPGGSPDQMGIFVEAARMNHSCAPNVFHKHNYHINRLTVHALRDIAPGEEILTSYIDICHPTAERRRLLRHWHFKCRCTACVAKDHGRQDMRRKKLEELMARMKKNERKRPMQGWSQWDYANALTMVEELIGLMEEDGLSESDTLGEAYANAAEYAMALGWWPAARDHAQRGVAIEKKCCGDDSAEYVEAAALLQAAQEGEAGHG